MSVFYFFSKKVFSIGLFLKVSLYCYNLFLMLFILILINFLYCVILFIIKDIKVLIKCFKIRNLSIVYYKLQCSII